VSAGSNPSILPYGGWPSELSARALVEGVAGLTELATANGRLYWLESRPDEGGRTVLVASTTAGIRDLTPAPYNVRSRVHEYGGSAYTVADNRIFFVNFTDQNLYECTSDGAIHQLTHSDAGTRFADFTVDQARNRLISVVEQHGEAAEPENFLGTVDLANGELDRLCAGHDFYAAPKLSPAGDRLAFVAWDHPNMPWDGTVLQVGRFGADGSLEDLATVAGGAAESVLQPGWQTDACLLFFSDCNGYWNLYRYDESAIYCVLEDGTDYADPPWSLGARNYAIIDPDHVLITRHAEEGQELVLVNTRTTIGTPFLGDDAKWCQYASPCTTDGNLYFIGGYPDRSPTIEQVPLDGGPGQTLRSAGGPEVAAADVSRGRALTFNTRDGATAHGFFYPPQSARFTGPADELPPLLVMSHGGPTAATSNALSLRIQYYTTRGWAVFDVNYRGSTGFGRAYRTALNGNWGITDVTDCEDSVRHLVSQRLVDGDRIAIRGGSAGGFTTLAALTTTECFKAGASHYGIGDLKALERDTHKFESRYLQGLLGDPAALRERSPINHLDRFRCPVIFFQGSEDRVVPPNQSRSMAAALRSKGIPVAYLEFEGEGHGFRDGANIIRAVESEYGFFCRVFGIEPADQLPPITIDNDQML
jgi:dipeptidyl aminopeptidase/acylaminoacyl peptidase